LFYSAQTLPDWPEWEVAHEKEFNAFEAQGTYVWVKRSPNIHIHRCRELFDIKTDNFGNAVKRKLLGALLALSRRAHRCIIDGNACAPAGAA
jgi:hypothetical protein